MNRLILFLALGVMFLLGGCLHERLTWSPDGSRAALIADDGLYLIDAAGRPSPLQVPGAYRAAWLGDSQRLVVARWRGIKDLAGLNAALGADRARALSAKAEAIWQQWPPDRPAKEMSSILPNEDAMAVAFYLREHHREELKQRSGEDWKDIESATLGWSSLIVGRVEADKFEITATLHEGLAEVTTIRPSPNSPFVAYVAHDELPPEANNNLNLMLAPLDGSTPAVLVASNTARHPDWRPDGRALVYLKAVSGNSDDARLGSIIEREVVDASGHIALAEKPRELAGLIFHDGNRIRCLRDGRVLFSAAEFHLPVLAHDQKGEEELFVIPADPKAAAIERWAPGAPWSKPLAFFEISPDETEVLVADEHGKVWRMAAKDGHVEEICEGFKGDDSIAPAWRKAGEFSYRKPAGKGAEIVLRRGAEETVLSRDWPEKLGP